jgi:hypothetical protein
VKDKSGNQKKSEQARGADQLVRTEVVKNQDTKESKRVRGAQRRGTTQHHETRRPRERGNPRSGEFKGRDKLGQKKQAKQGTLTDWRAKRHGQVSKGSEQTTVTHQLEIEGGID